MSEQCYRFSNGEGTKVVHLPATMTLQQLMMLGVSRIFLDTGNGEAKGHGFSFLPQFCIKCNKCEDTANAEGLCPECEDMQIKLQKREERFVFLKQQIDKMKEEEEKEGKNLF